MQIGDAGRSLAMLDLSAAAQHAGEQRAIANSEQVEQRMKPALSSEMASIRYVPSTCSSL